MYAQIHPIRIIITLKMYKIQYNYDFILRENLRILKEKAQCNLN